MILSRCMNHALKIKSVVCKLCACIVLSESIYLPWPYKSEIRNGCLFLLSDIHPWSAGM